MIGIKGKPRPINVRFWEKVNKTDSCWIWIGAIDDRGYGSMGINGRTQRAHRVSYQLANGSIPKGMAICHSCDNRLCVNPDHLFLGTFKENTQDMMRKGRDRHPKGSERTDNKLIESQIIEIRKRYSNGESTRKIAKDYPVHHVTIHSIVSRKKWKHVN